MSCAVAISNSPVFSPSRISSSHFCKSPFSSSSSSAEAVTLTARSPSSCPSSPSSPLRLRIQSQKPPRGLFRASTDGGSSSSTIVKRKRPSRLDIPIASLSFCGAPATPSAAAEGWREDVEIERDEYSVYCKRGRREAMEDRYSASLNLQGDSKQALFGVFDGHGGAKAADFAAKNLHKNILDAVDRKEGVENIEEAVKCGYLNTDEAFLREDLSGGSCCVTALVRKGNLVVSNAGDCRAVMSRGGIAENLTSDHRPSREDEKDRIETSGGYVDSCRGVWRIQGSLAVSRGIGDRHLKQWVIAEPETKILRIEPEFEFLILASDGLWDKVSNQEAVNIARPLCVGTDKTDLLAACKKLVDLSASRGSSDDISVMLIPLKRFC